ncbi:MAG TPA: hypothetical protein VII01_13275 [Solirubrobacteraceae bacterium]
MRLAAAALALVALALTGCETTAEKSARLEAAAKRLGRPTSGASRGLSIAALSTAIKVRSTAVVHSREGTAAIVTLRNDSATALRDIPIEITVRDASGASIYSNNRQGLGRALISVPLIGAHTTLTWVDDQIQATGIPATVAARVGRSPAVHGPTPSIALTGAHMVEDPSTGPGAAGTVVNHSSIGQRELIVYAVARRGSRILAAGRAVIPEAAPSASTPFQLFFIGDPRGGKLSLSVPATTLR